MAARPEMLMGSGSISGSPGQQTSQMGIIGRGQRSNFATTICKEMTEYTLNVLVLEMTGKSEN